MVIRQEDSGWSFLRTERGDEGWFPTSFIEPLQKYVEILDEEVNASLLVVKDE